MAKTFFSICCWNRQTQTCMCFETRKKYWIESPGIYVQVTEGQKKVFVASVMLH